MTTPTRSLLARALAGDAEAFAELGIALTERRPLPPVTHEPCEECAGSGRGPTIPNRYGPDYATRCETCHGDGGHYRCDGCGLLRSEFTTPRPEECQC